MKWSFASVGLIVFGLIGVTIIILFQELTTNNENDYYLLKEVTEAAMIDAIDIPYYRETGNLKIVREKFVENFIRRYAESTIFATNEYNIYFYEIMETPPKVSIIINTGIGSFTIAGDSDEYNIQNKLDAILEYTGNIEIPSATNSNYDNSSLTQLNSDNPYITKTLTKTYYIIDSVKKEKDASFGFTHSLRVPMELNAPNIKNIQIYNVKTVTEVAEQSELNEALLQRELSFYNIEDGTLLSSKDETKTNYMQLISEYETNISKVEKLEFYNCGINTSEYNCNETNKYFTSGIIKTESTNKDKVIAKYEVTWSYKEYEFIES